MNKHYSLIELQHANLKKPISILLGSIAGYHASDKAQCTYVYTTAGIFPAAESPEQITQIIKGVSASPDQQVAPLSNKEA